MFVYLCVCDFYVTELRFLDQNIKSVLRETPTYDPWLHVLMLWQKDGLTHSMSAQKVTSNHSKLCLVVISWVNLSPIWGNFISLYLLSTSPFKQIKFDITHFFLEVNHWMQCRVKRYTWCWYFALSFYHSKIVLTNARY